MDVKLKRDGKKDKNISKQKKAFFRWAANWKRGAFESEYPTSLKLGSCLLTPLSP